MHLIIDGNALQLAVKLGKKEKVTSQYYSQMLLSVFGFHVASLFESDADHIGSKTYMKASLGSEATMQKKGISVGSRVEVVIANDVIPKIERVITQ